MTVRGRPLEHRLGDLLAALFSALFSAVILLYAAGATLALWITGIFATDAGLLPSADPLDFVVFPVAAAVTLYLTWRLFGGFIAGFRPAFAGAVEAAASTGGQIMPPVMGVVAFFVAGQVGLEYRYIVVAAIVPTLFYYTGTLMAVHFETRRCDIGTLPREQRPGLDARGRRLARQVPLPRRGGHRALRRTGRRGSGDVLRYRRRHRRTRRSVAAPIGERHASSR